MKWYRLKENRCPRCESPLTFNSEKKLLGCHSCDFKIAEDKFWYICSDLESKELERQNGKNDENTTKDDEYDDIW